MHLTSAFHQLELTKESRNITAFQTEDKVKRFTRLIFGANSAAEELQHALRTIPHDIDGAINIADDILIFGYDESNHDDNLKVVLKRLSEEGITLNLQKCLFDKEQLEYFGYIFSKDGIKPSQKKIEALQNTERPEDARAVRSFLGLTNYLKRFTKDYSTITHPLRQLIRQNTEFVWSTECEQAFSQLKSVLTDNTCTAYFDNDKETFLYCDASPVGISSILLQKSIGKENAKIVAYTSRSLSETEQRYSQLERECLSVLHACERNRLYLVGRQFTIYNDHKALVSLLKNPNAKIPLRIERMVLRLQNYDFELIYVKGENNISDYTSRHPTGPASDTDINEKYVNFVSSHAVPNFLTIEDIEKETHRDPLLQAVIHLNRNNNWHALDELHKHEFLNGIDIHELKLFRKIKQELTIVSDSLILKENRIVLPAVFQKTAVNIAHYGHLGIQKTKALLRSKIFFHGMDKLVEHHISVCLTVHNTNRGIAHCTYRLFRSNSEWIIRVYYDGFMLTLSRYCICTQHILFSFKTGVRPNIRMFWLYECHSK